MSVFQGSNKIKNIYIGGTKIKKAYIGGTQVYSSGVSFDAFSSMIDTGTFATHNVSWSHTNNGNFLVVYLNTNNGYYNTSTTVSYGGVSMSKHYGQPDLFVLFSPPTGTHSVTVNASYSGSAYRLTSYIAGSYSGVASYQTNFGIQSTDYTSSGTPGGVWSIRHIGIAASGGNQLLVGIIRSNSFSATPANLIGGGVARGLSSNVTVNTMLMDSNNPIPNSVQGAYYVTNSGSSAYTAGLYSAYSILLNPS